MSICQEHISFSNLCLRVRGLVISESYGWGGVGIISAKLFLRWMDCGGGFSGKNERLPFFQPLVPGQGAEFRVF